MNVPTGRLQFFGLEASDYLERLEIMFRRPTTPDTGELVRLTRALRGSAVMAGLQPLAHAATALERLAKSLRHGALRWEQLQAQPVGRLLEQFKALVKRAVNWSAADTEAADVLARNFARISGDDLAVNEPKPSLEPGLTPSVRAFVGREGALVAGTLEHAAQALELGQPDAAIDAVLQRLQPLRGLAALPDISPLPEFLDAVELAIKGVRREAAPADGPLALRSAAAAVAALARSIAAGGSAAPDAPEVTHGALSLLETFGREEDVVAIDSLFAAGDSRPIVAKGSPPQLAPSTDPSLELVSLADRLRHAAEQLGETPGQTGRSLLLYTLVVQLRQSGPANAGARPALRALLGAISRAMGSGRASQAPDLFAALLRRTAERLMRVADMAVPRLYGDEFDGLIAEFEALGREELVAAMLTEESAPLSPAPMPSMASETPPAEPEPAIASETLPTEPEPPIASETVRPEPMPAIAAEAGPPAATVNPEPNADASVVPIESLLWESPAEAAVHDPTPFEQSFSSYHRLRQEEERETAPAPLGTAPEVEAEPEPEPVAIGSLLFRGRRALERANEVRQTLAVSLKEKRPLVEIEPLVSELIDLVPLALED